MTLRYAVDTNVLLRLSHSNHPQRGVITAAMRRLSDRDAVFCFNPSKYRGVLECEHATAGAQWIWTFH